MPGDTRNKRNTAQKIDSRQRMTQMMLVGYSQDRIAAELGISQGQVSRDWKEVVKQLVEARNKDIEDQVAIKLAEIRTVREEAWDAWVRSKRRAKQVVHETIPAQKCTRCGGSGFLPGKRTCNKCLGAKEKPGFTKITTTVKGRLPDSNYLRTILECFKQERELTGIDPAKELHLQGKIDWDLLARGVPEDGEPPDIIEGEILKVLQYDPNKLDNLPGISGSMRKKNTNGNGQE